LHVSLRQMYSNGVNGANTAVSTRRRIYYIKPTSVLMYACVMRTVWL